MSTVGPTFTVSNQDPVFQGLFKDKDSSTKMDMEQFFSILTRQMSNQDFMNPMNDSDFIAQMAQFNTIQALQEMNYNLTSSFTSSLIGKTVVVSKVDDFGNLHKDEGVVSKVSFVGNEFELTINGKTYKMKNVMEVKAPPAASAEGIEPETDSETTEEATPADEI